jgi:hypothetical protein
MTVMKRLIRFLDWLFLDRRARRISGPYGSSRLVYFGEEGWDD